MMASEERETAATELSDSFEPYSPDDVAALVTAGEQLRADSGRIDIYEHSSLAMWASLADDVIYSLRRAGWTVIPPDTVPHRCPAAAHRGIVPYYCALPDGHAGDHDYHRYDVAYPMVLHLDEPPIS